MAVDEKLAIELAAIPFFKDMPADDLAAIAACAVEKHYADGEFLLRQGDAADCFYVVRQGFVSLEVHAPGRGSLIVETVHANDVVGWSWIVPPYATCFDARARGPVAALRLDAGCMRPLMQDRHGVCCEIHRRFISVMAERLWSARVQLVDLYGHPATDQKSEADAEALPPAKPAPPEAKKQKSKKKKKDKSKKKRGKKGKKK